MSSFKLPAPPASRASIAAPAVLTLAAAALRFGTLDAQGYWLDEAVVVRLLGQGLDGVLDSVAATESTPPLYYVLAWLWTQLFGTGEVGLRSLSALAGTAFVPVAYLAGRRLVSERAGLMAAALACVNPLLVYYSQEARAYGLLMLFGGLSLLAFVGARERPTGRALGGWALASALALASHYYAVFLVVPEGVWLAVVLRRRALPALAAVGAVGAALAPLALHQRGLDHAFFIRETSLGGRLTRLPKQFLVGFEGPAETLLALAAGALSLCGAALVLRAGDQERRAALIVGVLAVIAVLIPVAVAPDTFGTRNSLAAWLPAALVLVTGFAAARPRRLGTALVAALAAIGLFTVLVTNLDPARGRDDWRGAAEALGPPPRGGRAVVVTPEQGGIPLSLYLPGLKPLPAGVARVTEVVAIGVAPGGVANSAAPPRPRPPPSPPAPLRLVRREYAPGYSLAVYRSPVPVEAVSANLPVLTPAEPSQVLLQRP